MTSPKRPSKGPCAPSEHPRRVARVANERRARSRAKVIRTVANIFVAAGDAHRLRLLLLLLDGPMSTRDLSKATGRTVSLVSQQMRVLRDAKLVSGAREGRQIVYAIIHRRMHSLLEMCIEHAVKRGRPR